MATRSRPRSWRWDAEIADGTFSFDDADEDVHSAIERGVIDRLGDLGARLHAGRSRNDLVMTDLRLWLLDAHARIRDLATGLIDVLLAHAREHADSAMPGTTHGRFAQPVTLGHHLLAHTWPLVRDLERFDQWAGRAVVSPLGAGALATSTLGLDPATTAHDLGFSRSFENSIDAVSDRDFVLEFLATTSICSVHLSRLAADLIRWTDPMLGWAELADEDATGSSMMPQKRNPDPAELARAKPARYRGGFRRPLRRVARAPARLPPRPARGQGTRVRCGRYARARARGARWDGGANSIRCRHDATGGLGSRSVRDGCRGGPRAGRRAVP